MDATTEKGISGAKGGQTDPSNGVSCHRRRRQVVYDKDKSDRAQTIDTFWRSARVLATVTCHLSVTQLSFMFSRLLFNFCPDILFLGYSTRV